jgi:hypothetical protein
MPDEWEAAFESHAGYLNVEDCVLAHLSEAQKLGAELRSGVAVRSWHANGNSVTVETDAGKFEAANGGTLLRDGVGLVPALGIAKDVLGNLTAAKIVETAASRVRAGARLAASLAGDGFFPRQTIHLIQLGEETGKLADMATGRAKRWPLNRPPIRPLKTRWSPPAQR